MNDHRDKGRVDLERGCHLYSAGKIEEAFTVFQYAAKLGSLEAQVNLANLLDSGAVGEKNCKQAAYWYKRAIKNGSPEAAYNLAISYRQQGKSRWFGYWIRKAAEMGDEDALDELPHNVGKNVKPTRNA